MKVLKTSAFIIDRENEKKIPKDIGDDAKDYANFLIENVQKSNKKTLYKLISEESTVFRLSREITTMFLAQDNDIEKCGSAIDEDRINYCFEEIGTRFLEAEIAGQKSVDNIHKIKIKTGCLIQIVIKKTDRYQYLIAKLGSLDFLTESELRRERGYQIDEKKLGKSCLFTFKPNKNVLEVDTIKLLLDNPAAFFVDKFLELKPVYNDDVCTEKMVDSTLKVIDTLKRDYPQDRRTLRNRFITYVKSNDFFDYEDMIENVFSPVMRTPECKIKDKKGLLEKVASLPEKNKFSPQFNIVPKKIKATLVEDRYSISKGIDLVIKDDVKEEIFEIVESMEDKDGRNYLKIYTHDKEIIETFRKNND